MDHKLRFFLIDYENTHEKGLVGYDQLTAEDTVIIFCSENASSLNGLMLANLQKRSIQFQIKNSQTGTKNAMDFQLATEVGRLIGENHDGHKCVIISSDQGFNAVKQYWKAENVLVSIQPSIQDFLRSTSRQPAPVVPEQPQKAKTNYPFQTHEDYSALVKSVKVTDKDKELAFNLLQQTKTVKDSGKRKQTLHAKLCQTFGQEKGALLYRSIKTIIK